MGRGVAGSWERRVAKVTGTQGSAESDGHKTEECGARMLGCETRNLYDKQMGTRGEIYTGHGK